MQRAIISGIAIAILCSVVGLFLVLRRYSLFGDAIAHSSFGGIALGLVIGRKNFSQIRKKGREDR